MEELLPMRRKHETINRSNSVPGPVYWTTARRQQFSFAFVKTIRHNYYLI